MFFSRSGLDHYFKTRPEGMIFYPSGKRSGRGYLISSPDSVAALRDKLSFINRMEMVWPLLIVLALWGLHKLFPDLDAGFFLTLLVSFYLSEGISFFWRHVEARRFPPYEETVIEAAG